MDREVRGENSSSRNVNLEVTDIRRGAEGEVVAFDLSDGSSFFVHPRVAAEFSVRPGSVFSTSELEEIQRLTAVYAARGKAVEYLARREHSSSELVLKLRKKGYDRDTAEEAVELCRDRGYVDDRRFAELWVESRLKNHPEGMGNLAAGLARKGVPREIAASVLDECVSEETLRDSLSRCMDKYLRTRSTDPRRLVNHLLRKGFRYAEIKRSIAGLEEFSEDGDIGYE